MIAWFSRLGLLWKILLSTSVAVTILFAFTGQIVLQGITRTMSDSLNEEVRASLQAYTSYWNSRAERLSAVSRLLSTMAAVRAAFSTGDRATIQDTAGELWSKISDASAIFLVTDPRGQVIASLGGVTPLSQKNMDVVRLAEKRFPQQSSGFFLQDGELYHISITPVYVDSTQGQALLNVLVAGYHVDALVAQGLQEATGGSEFLFLTPGQVIASTLNPRATGAAVASLARARPTDRVSDGVAEYAFVETPLPDILGSPVGQLAILRSFEAARQRISSMYTNIILFWLVAVSAGFVLRFHRCCAAMPAKKLAEQVTEAGTRTGAAAARLSTKIKSAKIKVDVSASRVCSAAVAAGRCILAVEAILVVHLPFPGIRQHVIRFLQLFEFFLGRLVPGIQVGMIRPCQLAKSRANILRRRFPRHSQQFVIVLFCSRRHW